MTAIRIKKIKNKKYNYAEHSFRIPDGKVKKISKLIKNEEDARSKETEKYFLQQEITANQKYALKT